MRQFMTNDEKRAWKQFAKTYDATPSEWVVAEVVHNNHLNETFVPGAIVHARRDGEGWLVVRVTPSVVRPLDPTYGVVRLNSTTKAKWSLRTLATPTGADKGKVWRLARTTANSMERIVQAWREGKLADL